MAGAQKNEVCLRILDFSPPYPIAHKLQAKQCQPVGLAWLIVHFNMRVLRPYHLTYVSRAVDQPVAFRLDADAEEQVGETHVRVLPRTFPGLPSVDTPAGHLLFATEQEPVDLGVLRCLFCDTPEFRPASVLAIAHSARRAWFAYEWLTGNRLNELEDMSPLEPPQQLLDPSIFFVHPYSPLTPGQRVSKRHAVVNNTLSGDPTFCPSLRRTDCLVQVCRLLQQRHQSTSARLLPLTTRLDRWATTNDNRKLLKEAVRALYAATEATDLAARAQTTDKTVPVDAQRRRAMLALLQSLLLEEQRRDAEEEEEEPQGANAADSGMVDEAFILQLKSAVTGVSVDSYRKRQVYLSKPSAWQSPVRCVPPRPEDVPALMAALIRFAAQLEKEHNRKRAHATEDTDSQIAAPVVAAVVAFLFDVIHPFEDGNGRVAFALMQRFLRRCGGCPRAMLHFPLAALLMDRKAQPNYHRCLHDWDRRVMACLERRFEFDGKTVRVEEGTAAVFAFPDCTLFAELVAQAYLEAASTHIPNEVAFLGAVADAVAEGPEKNPATRWALSRAEELRSLIEQAPDQSSGKRSQESDSEEDDEDEEGDQRVPVEVEAAFRDLRERLSTGALALPADVVSSWRRVFEVRASRHHFAPEPAPVLESALTLSDTNSNSFEEGPTPSKAAWNSPSMSFATPHSHHSSAHSGASGHSSIASLAQELLHPLRPGPHHQAANAADGFEGASTSVVTAMYPGLERSYGSSPGQARSIDSQSVVTAMFPQTALQKRQHDRRVAFAESPIVHGATPVSTATPEPHHTPAHSNSHHHTGSPVDLWWSETEMRRMSQEAFANGTFLPKSKGGRGFRVLDWNAFERHATQTEETEAQERERDEAELALFRQKSQEKSQKKEEEEEQAEGSFDVFEFLGGDGE